MTDSILARKRHEGNSPNHAAGQSANGVTPAARVLAALRDHGQHVARTPRVRHVDGRPVEDWRASCPACGARRALSVVDFGHAAAVYCHACCGTTRRDTPERAAVVAEIVGAVGLTLPDLRAAAGTRAWRAALDSWRATVVELDWSSARTTPATVARVASAGVSFGRQAGGPTFEASGAVFGQRGGRSRTATARVVRELRRRGYLRAVSRGRYVVAADGGAARVPTVWTLTTPSVDGPVTLAPQNVNGGHILRTGQLGAFGASICPSSSFSDGPYDPAEAAWLCAPGRDVDDALGRATRAETLAAVLTLPDGWTLADVAARFLDLHSRKRPRGTVAEHVRRFVGRGFVRVVSAGGRGRGRAARYALDLPRWHAWLRRPVAHGGAAGAEARTRRALRLASERAFIAWSRVVGGLRNAAARARATMRAPKAAGAVVARVVVRSAATRAPPEARLTFAENAP